jgi:hypothetical protein
MFKEQVQQLATEWNLSVSQLAEVAGIDLAFLESKLDTLNDHSGSIPVGLENLATLIGLQNRLKRLFPETEKQIEWLSTSNPHFDGLKPLDVIRTGPENTQWLSYYLETRLNFFDANEDE